MHRVVNFGHFVHFAKLLRTTRLSMFFGQEDLTKSPKLLRQAIVGTGLRVWCAVWTTLDLTTQNLEEHQNDPEKIPLTHDLSKRHIVLSFWLKDTCDTVLCLGETAATRPPDVDISPVIRISSYQADNAKDPIKSPLSARDLSVAILGLRRFNSADCLEFRQIFLVFCSLTRCVTLRQQLIHVIRTGSVFVYLFVRLVVGCFPKIKCFCPILVCMLTFFFFFFFFLFFFFLGGESCIRFNEWKGMLAV